MAVRQLLSPGTRPWLYGLAVVVLIEVLWYPLLATAAYTFFSGRGGWDGSALDYVQRYRVAPVGAVFSVLILAFAARSSLQGREPDRRAVIGAWLMNVTLFAISVLWYAKLAD